MLFIYEIILLLVAFILNQYYYSLERYMGSVLCVLIIIYICMDLFRKTKFMFWNYYMSMNQTDDFNDNNELFYSNKTTTWDNSHIFNTSDNLKEIEKKIRISKNFIAFCDNKIIKDSTLTILHNKPKIAQTKLNVSSDTSNFVSKLETDNLDSVRKLVYQSILKILNKQSLKVNERYALLQSFYYIEITPTTINIYIDKLILQKSGLSDFNLCKTSIKQELCNILCFPHLEVNFLEVKSITLLNYFINNQQNEN